MSGISRRSFLTGLLGAAGAAVAVSHLEALAPFDADAPLEPNDPTYHEVLAMAERIFSEKMRRYGMPIDVRQESIRLGGAFADGIAATEAVGVATDPYDDLLFVEPAMAQLAHACVERGLDTFAGGQVLPAHAIFAGTRGPLRLIVFYDVLNARTVMRFDVCGGASSAGQRAAAQFKATRIKANIRRRIGTYPKPERLV